MERLTPVLLAVGTTHPLNIAGLGLDARVAASLGVRLVTVVAGISAQTARSVLIRTPVDAATIAAQFAALRDVPIGAVHVGALLDAASVTAVAHELARRPETPVVCDPVVAATGGDRLADDATIAALRDHLFPCCSLVTPNADEAALLSGVPRADIAAMEAAGTRLLAMGAGAILVKGGHLAGKPVDVLVTRTEMTRFGGERIGRSLRGTGDLLAAALAARLAHGDSIVAAVAAARAFVRDCIVASVPFAGAQTIP